ncbi:hypothetical protein JB92DRAFT_3148370 [Gautieria morchelliformis]|nr:hypothetical protein JB92DRAFT_3148370 [Gautieria morchelliformis]
MGTSVQDTPLSTKAEPDTLEDVDLIWGYVDDVPNREWSKLDDDFTNAGYREGITAGKESALQEGFNDGFARVGVPLGREIGLLRGAANAAMGFLSSRKSDADPATLERRNTEVLGVIGGLGRINLVDLSPPDLQAQEHAREHLDFGTSTNTLVSPENAPDVHMSDFVLIEPLDGPLMARPAVEELDRLRMRLSNVLQAIGLDIQLI